MSPSQATQVSQGIINFLSPQYEPIKLKGTITIHDMDVEPTLDNITVSLHIIDENDTCDVKQITVEHAAFNDFLEYHSLLDMEIGQYDEANTITVDYATYLQSEYVRKDMKRYLIEKNIINYNWEKHVR